MSPSWPPSGNNSAGIWFPASVLDHKQETNTETVGQAPGKMYSLKRAMQMKAGHGSGLRGGALPDFGGRRSQLAVEIRRYFWGMYIIAQSAA
jgi:hypothetical protein